MPAKKRAGGRVTPKGTQPTGSHGGARGERTAPVRGGFRPSAPGGGRPVGPVGPTRSGHHRGNR